MSETDPVKKKNTLLDKSLLRQSTKISLLVVVVALVTLEATSLIQFFYTQRSLRDGAGQRARGQLEATESKIADIIHQTETAVLNNAWIAGWALDHPDSIGRICYRLVDENEVIAGSTIAFVPGFLKDHPIYSPYWFKDPEGMHFRSLATPEYNYPEKEWFKVTAEQDNGLWSEPYIDTGGGEMLMTTFSYPVHDGAGKFAAVLTADLSLDWLQELVGSVKLYPSAYSMLFSRAGRVMVGPTDSLVMNTTLDELAALTGDTAGFGQINRDMLSGKAGSAHVRLNGKEQYIFYAPVERTGWSMSIVIPDDEIFGGVRRVGRLVGILQLLGLLMLVVILRSFITNQLKVKALNEKKEKMEGELHIASAIQMSMVPKVFPAFPERKDLDLAASLVPAKEVGGDLYDFFIRDEKLFFCVGDVSGKGVPAALIMAVTRSSFRAVSSHEDAPGTIVNVMNKSLSDMNESNMFVTFFCGVLDLESGHLSYCNSGHNPPMIFTDAIRPLPVAPNLPMGILSDMVFTQQETFLQYDDALFIYTDGLTEAENSAHELFGEERMEQALHGRKGSYEHLVNIQKKVEEFVGEAPQSDDLTMLFIHYLGKEHTATLTLENDIREISRLAAWTENVCKRTSLSQADTLNVNLALEEAATNVILYAYPEGTKGEVNLRADISEDSITFVLSDSGKPFDPTARPPVDITAGVEERAIGGLGIHLVLQIMDTVTYGWDGGKNILTMIKKF